MKAVLEILKAHGISIGCGLVIAAAVTFGVLGMSSDTVVKALDERKSEIGASSIAGLRSEPKNEAIIEAEQKRVEQFKSEYDATRQTARKINLRREPLLEGVFPKLVNDEIKFRFGEAYKAAVRRLPIELEAGTLPTEADLAEEQQNVEEAIQNLRERQEEEAAIGDDRQPGAEGVETPVAQPPPPPIAPPGGATPPWLQDDRGAGNPYAPPGGGFGGPGGTGRPEFQLTAEQQADPKFNVTFRARVAKARSIRLYLDDVDARDPVNTFDVSPVYQAQTPPGPVEMWTAQMSLWITQDIVEAIRSLNEKAAAAVEEPNVEHMPVKRLSAVRIFGYDGVTGERMPFGSAAAAGALEKTAETPTGLTPGELFDVVRFRVTAVVDQRDVVALIDAISRQNFYQCVDASYQVVDREAEQNEGFFYGSDPVVRVTLEFEGYFLREVYAKLMPDAVKRILGIEGAGEGEGGEQEPG